MGESFEKLKYKCLLAAIVKSAVVGVSAGLFAAGAVLLSLALGKINIHWAFYLLIAVGTAAAAGGVSFLLMRPTDMKVAKKYDAEYNLNEKLQTMVAFAGADGEIIRLQREDACARLASVPAQKVRFSRIWQYCLIAVLALAMILSAAFVPAAAQTVTPPDGTGTGPITEDPIDEEPVFEYDLFMQSAMGELILNVRESSLAATEKGAIVSVLEELDGNLALINKQSDMQVAVLASVTLIDGIIYNANSFRKICEKLLAFDAHLTSGIYDAIAVYDSGTTPLSDYTRVKAFETRLGDLVELALEEPLGKSAVSLKVPQEGRENADTGETEKLADILPAYIGNLALVAEAAGEGDAILAALDTFGNALKATSAKLGKGYRDDTLFKEIDAAYTALNTNLNAALVAQSYNCVMNVFVRLRLAAIFGISAEQLPPINEDISSGEGGGTGGENGGEDNSGGGGGNGNYDFIYGSDDIIYDPDRADYISFGEVLDSYYTKMQNRVIAGDVPDDLAEILQKYFEILYNGLQDEPVEEE